MKSQAAGGKLARFLPASPASIYPGHYQEIAGDQAMSTTCIRFHCPSCRARIKAPLLLAGRNRSCPGCERILTIPRNLPEDSAAISRAVGSIQEMTAIFHHHLTEFSLLAISTGRQGGAIDWTYVVRFRSGAAATALVGELNHLEGMHQVELRRA
jgi:hypothetical protein